MPAELRPIKPEKVKVRSDQKKEVGPAHKPKPVRKGPVNRTSAESIERANRTKRALELRQKGWTYDQIAADIGYAHPKNAQRLISEALDLKAKECSEKADELRREALDKLDYYLRSLDEGIAAGNPKAVMAAVAIDKRKAALLGIDKPQQVEHTGTVKTYAIAEYSPECPTWPRPPEAPKALAACEPEPTPKPWP